MHPLDEMQTDGCLAGGGELGRLMRAFDWSATPVGLVAGWPQSLKIVVRILLDSRYAMWLGWGPDFTFFYNDAYARMSLGAKHPWALGRSAREVWAEIWNDIGPRAESVVRSGQATWDERLLLFLERRGFPEETYHTFSYSPVPDDRGGVGGMLCVVTEDTDRVIGERRLRILRELAAQAPAESKSAEETCQTAFRTLAVNPYDVPFALLYLIDADARHARLAGATGLTPGSLAAPAHVDLGKDSNGTKGWPFDAVLESGKTEVVTDLKSWLGPMPASIYPESPHTAAVLPVHKTGQDRLAGFLVAGISPRRPFDDEYRGFLDLLAGQIANSVANARAYEEERQRAEALAELDRAKTAFFSNVSHEFRTPLTLMLGPVEDALAQVGDDELSVNRETLGLVHRNGLRLQKLVNTLLDFSRIEAGRVQALFEPTKLDSFTTELASNFRSACQRANLELTVNCTPLSEPVYVDREMWERVVLNLLSNAFKYTLAGSIAVELRQVGRTAELRVRDTGTGIPPDQMPHLFERFYRVEGAKGRTQEGSGIGLALIRELVRLHGGEVRAESEFDSGSVFTVAIPLGKAHLPADRVGSSNRLASITAGGATYVEEALRWLPNAETDVPAVAVPKPLDGFSDRQTATAQRPRILLADDNADMRNYIARLLNSRYDVEAVWDGLTALRSARFRPPDLILSDVMMPGLDGFGLLKALRADPATATIPILLLSARSGEEARVEGLDAGADDYLTKPFSAKELLARVQAHLSLARMRHEAGEALKRSEWFHRLVSELTSDFTFSIRFDQGAVSPSVEFLSPGFTMITGYTLAELNNRGGWPTIVHPEDLPVTQRTVERLFAGQEDEGEARLIAKDGTMRWIRYLSQPVKNASGAVTGFIGAAQHLTDRKQAEEALREANATLRSFYDTAPVMMGVVEVSGDDVLHLTDNAATGEFFGVHPDRLTNRRASEMGVAPDVLREWIRHYRESEATGKPVRFEYLHATPAGTRWLSAIVYCMERLPEGGSRCSYVAGDVTERKRVEAALNKQSERLRLLWEAATVLLTTDDPDAMLRTLFAKLAPHFGLDAYFNFLVNDSGDSLRMGSCAGIPDEEARKITRLEFGQAVCGTVALRRQPIVATHIQDSDEAMVQLVKGYGIRSYACNPLLVEDRLLGTLSFASRNRDDFDADELEFLATICRYVTVAYERLRLVHQLREQDRRKDEFLATLAHELRNPLAPIRNSLQILKMPRLDAPTAERARQMMERQVHHLVHLVDDLLDVSRVMRGKIALRKERIELASVVARAVETVQPLIEAQGHRLSVRFAEDSLSLEADAVRLAQVVGNLLTNAAKYMERGGSIDLTARPEDNYAVLRIRDTGIGITENMLPKVFDLFVQVDQNSTRSQGGLGIGLTLVKNLVEMHGGRVEARSPGLGHGSEFVVRLPLAAKVPEAPTPFRSDRMAVAGDGQAKRQRILVVDDNVDAAESLAMLLRLLGHEVHVAHNGPSALKMVPINEPHLMFLDIGMPGMDGYEVARQLRKQPGRDRLLIVALTGWGAAEDRRRTAEAGFNHHLVKPVEPKAIEDLLASMETAPSF